MQEIIQTISTSIHDDPPSSIPPFDLILDEDINDDFLRGAIESIAHHYNSHYPGNIVVSISIMYYTYIKCLYTSDCRKQ